MKSRLLFRVLGVVIGLTPLLAHPAARLDPTHKSESRNLTLLPGPNLLSPAKQPSAGVQGMPSLQGEPLVPAISPPAPARHPAKVPPFDAQLSTGRNAIGGGSAVSGATMLSGPGNLRFQEQKWTFKPAPIGAPQEDAELKAAREKFEAAKAELEALLARRGLPLDAVQK